RPPRRPRRGPAVCALGPDGACRARGGGGLAPGRGARPVKGLTVVKVGGGLSSTPGALDSVAAALVAARGTAPLLVIPGGGPFAEAGRAFGRAESLSGDAAHWMAILGMEQYAHALAERIPAPLVEEPGGIRAALDGDGVAVLAPYRWMRAADVLPHTWDV